MTTVPIALHFNIPKIEWLYAGVGLTLNIPFMSLLDPSGGIIGQATMGGTFFALPVDIGFDFIKPGSGGGRFFFRIAPEFHEAATIVPIGFIWQMYNLKIF